MEELNKNQLILLTLLVSFVTSIATGIITVSLLQEAPPGVTQVINRVVEKTIEQAVTTTTSTGEKETVREVTVIVKEEDQVIDAISKNTKSIIRITDNALVDGAPQFYGMGFLLTKDGLVVSAAKEGINTATTYTGVGTDGKPLSMKFVGLDESKRLSFFRILRSGDAAIVIPPVSMAAGVPQLGQSVVTFDGVEKNAVIIGRISAVDAAADTNEISLIRTDISAVAKVIGAPLVNLSGEVIGIRISSEGSAQVFVPTQNFRKEISKFPL